VNSTKSTPLKGKGYGVRWESPPEDNVKRGPRDVNEIIEARQSDSLMRTARVDKLLGLLWDAYYPTGGDSHTSDSRASCGVLSAMYKLLPEDDAVRLILLATSLYTIGRRDRTIWMMQQGRRLYGASLRVTNTLLNYPTRAWSVGLLATVKALGLFEVHELRYSPKPTLLTAGHAGLLWLEPARVCCPVF
jgi:hypothetical protein